MVPIVKVHAAGPRVVARVTFVVESENGGETLSIGESDLDVQMVSLMPPTEYAVRHLWPAFIAAANAAKVTLPRLYGELVTKPWQS
jgi:hypothetical protein